MAKTLLVGVAPVTGSNTGANRAWTNEHVADETGAATEFQYFCDAAGSVKLALYDESDYSKLWDAEDSPSTTGLKTVDMSATAPQITSGDTYGLRCACDTSAVTTYESGVSGFTLWNDSITYSTYTYPETDDWTDGGTNNGVQLKLGVYGYPEPSITSVDGDNTISSTQTGVVLSGADLDDTSNATLELCNNADYSLATVKVTQTFNSQTDTSINFDVVQGGLSAGTVYAFVTTGAYSQRNQTGFSVTLESSGASDTLLGGTFSYSGLTLSANSAVSDAPQGATYSYSGLTLNTSTGVSDTLLGANYSYSGLNVDAQPDISDVPQGATYSYSGLDIDAQPDISDTPQGASYSYSGLTLNTSLGILDVLLGGNYSYSGLALDAVVALADTLDGGTYSYSGLLLDAEASTGVSDTLLGATFSYSGLDVDAYPDISDSPQGSTYSYSGLTLNTSTGVSDTLLGATYSYSGLDVDAQPDVSDSPQGGTYSYSGLLLDAEADIGGEDTLLGSTYSYSGLNIDAVPDLADQLDGATYSYSGLELEVLSGVSDILLGASYSYSGLDLSAISEVIDAPLGGTYSYSGLTLSASSSTDDTVTTTVYASQIAMAQRLIAARGQSVTWRQFNEPTTPDSDDPYRQSASTYVDYDSEIVFTSIRRKEDKFSRDKNGYTTPTGNLGGLLSTSDYVPKVKDIVLRGTEQLSVVNINEVAPNGEKILYKLEFSR